MTGYYDYVLGLIPAALIGLTATLMTVGLPLTSAVPVGAGAALVLMGHAMFVHNPVETPTTAGSSTTQSARGSTAPSQAD